jgi:hypothetical protein
MKIRILTFLCASVSLVSSAQAELISYWAFDNPALPDASFGYLPSDFPLSPNEGAGALTVALIDNTLKPNGAYDFLESFAGSTVNAQPGYVASGTISPEGSQNNGASIIFEVDTTSYTDLGVSWAQRGTSTGYTSRVFAYSTDGVTYTDFATDSGALTSTFVTESYDLSAIDALEGLSSVFFKITVDGATSANGNNRIDNLTVTGTLVPEPGTAILALLSLAAAGAVTMRSRLG